MVVRYDGLMLGLRWGDWFIGGDFTVVGNLFLVRGLCIFPVERSRTVTQLKNYRIYASIHVMYSLISFNYWLSCTFGA